MSISRTEMKKSPAYNLFAQHYMCAVCGTIVLCIKGGEGEIRCCDRSMALQDYSLLLDFALG